MLQNAMFIKHLEEVLKETFQMIIFDKQGSILDSNNTFVDLTPLLGTSVYDFDPFIESLHEVLDSLNAENRSIKFPRMEIPFGGRQGVFDHRITFFSHESGQDYFVWIVWDTTNSNQYLALVQQERNDAAIALELERLKTENELLSELVEERTYEIRKQAELIKLKSQSILQSIQYASRIQKAFHPTDSDLKSPLFDCFVFNLPRDVVSGDFFWSFQDEKHFLAAAVDCTGHGVPGAFLSLVGYTLFDQIVKTDGERSPSAILSKINQKLFNLLSHNTEEASISEGMDAALICIEKHEHTAVFAGAKRPLVLFRNNHLTEFRGSTASIGGRFIRDRIYENQVFSLQKDDRLYLFSDGYADQFGGQEDKRLGSSNFKKILSAIQTLRFEDQRQTLEDSFLAWKGEHRQIDDVTVVGIRWR